MKTEKNNMPKEISELRRRAEEKAVQSPGNTKSLSPEEMQRVLYELHVHQIELEMQNEELRTAQTDLNAARTRYFDLYDLAPAGYFTISEQGVVLEANLTAATLFGEDRGLLVKRLFSQFIIYEDQDIYYLHRKQLLETMEAQSFELRMLKKDGTAFWANLAVTVAVADGGAKIYRIVLVDITERKKIENTFHRMAQEWQRTFDSMSEAVWILDKDQVVLRSNKAAEHYFHMPCEEMVGKYCWEIVHGTTQPIPECPALRVRKSLRHESQELKLGEEWFDVAADPILDADGQFDGIIHIVTNITERKRMQDEKIKMESRLRQSQKMEAMGQLAGGISHDFNNLLSVINGYSQVLLISPDLKATLRPQAEEILRSGERAAVLTRQLLLFSRHQRVESKIIDLDAIITGMEKMLRRLIREDIIVNRKIGTPLWQIKADPGNMEQMIMNLAINASDAMPDGGTLTVEIENVKIDETNRLAHPLDINPGLYVMLSVSDTGCGMDDKVREHIFEPFFTTKEVGKGTGLGLATVYGIVKQSNGHIDVQSELGKGARFRIYFPQAVNEGVADEKQQDTASIPRGGETILLAEDEGRIRAMLQTFLQSIGYTVLPACNGKEALEIIEKRKGQIHLLLTDIVMPGMKGFELAKQAKDLLPEIKLLFMSGYDSNPDDTDKTILTGGNYIQKPISPYVLSGKLREILG